MNDTVADIARKLPGDASLRSFFDELQTRQTRVEIAGQSYRALLKAAEQAGDARKALAYFVVTASAAIFAGYVSILGRTDVVSEVVRNFIPSFGLFLCFMIMLFGKARYAEECTYVAQAVKTENAQGIENGGGATRAKVLQYTNWWIPSRDHLAAFCVLLFWAVVATIQAWHN